MSWTISIPPTPREDFEAAVDAAEASGQDQALPGVAADVDEAKGALKALAERVKRPLVSGTANGHCLQDGDGPNWHDGISVGVSGSEATPTS